MALDRQDIELLKEARAQGLTVDEIIDMQEKIAAQNELKINLKNIWGEIYMRFWSIIDTKIEEIQKLSSPEEMLKFVIQESFYEYKSYRAKVEEEEARRKEGIQKNGRRKNENSKRERRAGSKKTWRISKSWRRSSRIVFQT